jgi:hypothetical protein
MFLSYQKKSLESKIFALYVDHSIVPFKKSTTLLLCCFIKELRQYVMPIIVRSHIIMEKEEKKDYFLTCLLCFILCFFLAFIPKCRKCVFDQTWCHVMLWNIFESFFQYLVLDIPSDFVCTTWKMSKMTTILCKSCWRFRFRFGYLGV